MVERTEIQFQTGKEGFLSQKCAQLVQVGNSSLDTSDSPQVTLQVCLVLMEGDFDTVHIVCFMSYAAISGFNGSTWHW